MYAAGTVTWRGTPRLCEVLLVHRPKYDDWTIPKGKVDPGEILPGTAVRETAEETGLRVRLGVPLPSISYPVSRTITKRVSYWAASTLGDDDVKRREPDAEVDEVAWVELAAAFATVSYPRDRQVLAAFEKLVADGCADTAPLVVLRHAKARARSEWKGNDQRRPLTDAGQRQAARLVPMLRAYGIKHLLSSESTRCEQTLAPYADARERDVELSDELTEENARARRVRALAAEWLQRRRRMVVCTHRPVLPWVFEGLKIVDPGLEAGTALVVHRNSDGVVAVEIQPG